MRSLLKAVIIVAVAAGVVIPAGYYSLSVYNDSSITLPQLVPGNSNLVIRGEYNSTPIYAYNYSNTTGLVLGISMTGFSTQLSTAENSTNATHAQIVPVLYTTYRNYNVFQLSNVSIDGLLPSSLTTGPLPSNFTVNTSKYIQNGSLFLSELPGVVTVGNLAAVKLSLDAYLDHAGFQNLAQLHFNSTANISVYFKDSSSPIKQAIVNVYALKTTFDLEMSNYSNANTANKLLSSLNAYALVYNYNFTVATIPQGNWVNGTITIGVMNYHVLEDALSNLNSTQYLPGYNL